MDVSESEISVSSNCLDMVDFGFVRTSVFSPIFHRGAMVKIDHGR